MKESRLFSIEGIMVKYSIIIPAYNEESTLQIFYDRVTPVFESLQEEYELIFVNDGSRDKTEEILKGLCQKDGRVKACSFSRNFGQQAALLCGMELAKGQAVIAMDADLQDPPEVALEMIARWKEGYEIVHGKRKKRKGETVFKRATASLFYKFTRKITGMELQRDSGDFKLYDRKVVEVLLGLNEHDRLLRAQTAWVGFKQTMVEFDRPERVAGKTHYTLKKMVKLAESGIFPNTDYTLTFPLKLGILLSLLSVACFILFAILSGIGVAFGGLTAWLFPTIALAVGMILFFQGLSNMHVAMIYKEVQNRPKYIVTEKWNFDE